VLILTSTTLCVHLTASSYLFILKPHLNANNKERSLGEKEEETEDEEEDRTRKRQHRPATVAAPE